MPQRESSDLWGPNRTPRWAIALSGLTDNQRSRVQQSMKLLEYGPRKSLFSEGEGSTHIVVIQSGRVRLFRTSAGGEEFTTGVSGPGAVLGLIAVVLSKPRILSAETIDRAVISSLSGSALFSLMEEIPCLATNISRILAQLAMESIVRSGRMIDSAPVRLGQVLYSLAVPMDSDAPELQRIVRGFTHQDLATMVGTTRTWVTLTLAAFERQGLLARTKRVIVIPDAPRFLQFISEFAGARRRLR